MQSSFNKLRNRKQEHRFREETLRDVMVGLKDMKDTLPAIMEKKPWISEADGKDLSDKIEDTRTWLDEKIEAQAKEGLTADPVFTSDVVQQRVEKVSKLFKKTTDKKKPKEKKPKEKKPKNEESDDEKDHENEREKEEDL